MRVHDIHVDSAHIDGLKHSQKCVLVLHLASRDLFDFDFALNYVSFPVLHTNTVCFQNGRGRSELHCFLPDKLVVELAVRLWDQDRKTGSNKLSTRIAKEFLCFPAQSMARMKIGRLPFR